MADCYLAETTGRKTTWLIASPSERQSLESLEKWKEWAEAFKIRLADETELREATPEGILKAATITFLGGSRVIAVPGKPDTVRGYSANVLLTEFAFFENPGPRWHLPFTRRQPEYSPCGWSASRRRKGQYGTPRHCCPARKETDTGSTTVIAGYHFNPSKNHAAQRVR
jgi:hypothetical protein